MHDVDGVNAGYARLLLDEYLDNPEAVPAEWRALFERRRHRRARRRCPASPGCSSAAAAQRRRTTETGTLRRPATAAPAADRSAAARARDRARAAPARSRRQAARAPPRPTTELLGGVAAAMALVKAHRMHGHLAARLDPLGSEPVGDPALDPLRLEPKLTPELQARIPASVLRIHVAGDTLAEALPRLQETYCGSMAYEIEHIGDHEQRVWLRKAIESGRFRGPLAARGAAPPLRPPLRDRGHGALPAPRVPRPEAVLARGARRADPDARRVDRARRQRRGARGRDRDGPPRPAQRPRAHDRACPTSRSCASSRASGRSRSSPPTPRAAPATSSTTSAPRASARPRPARSRSRSPRTRATSRRSTRSSRG